VVLEYKAGEEVRKYGNNEGKRDEALDCAYGNLAVFMLRRWNFDALEADLALTKPDAPAPVAPQAAVFRGGGFRL
jgi:phage terminase large subunit GpA-like protein